MELEAGTIVADRFRLERELGKGAMGAVWLARHQALEIPCAVKFILEKSTANPEALVRFEREAKAAAQLRSPYVVQILDYGIEAGVPYLAMEYLEGETLRSRLQDQKQLGPEETFQIISQIGRALGKAHKAGIVHRDLKPANIFLVRDEDAIVAKVLDFGVAKDVSGPRSAPSATKTGALLGTPNYMSPEQAQGDKSVDARSDLWALAVLTYRCLTGQLPFKEQSLVDLLIAIVSGPCPVPSAVAPTVPEGFDSWWAKASQRDPHERFQSAAEQTEALSVALGLSHPTFLDQSVPMAGIEQYVNRSEPEPQPLVDSLATTSEWRRDDSPAPAAPAPSSPSAEEPIAVERSDGATVGGVLQPNRPRPSSPRAVLWLGLAALAVGGLAAALLVGRPPDSESSSDPTDPAAEQAEGAAGASLAEPSEQTEEEPLPSAASAPDAGDLDSADEPPPTRLPAQAPQSPQRPQATAATPPKAPPLPTVPASPTVAAPPKAPAPPPPTDPDRIGF